MKSITKRSTTNYPIGDFLIKVKNAAMAKNKEINVTSNKQIEALAAALKKQGFIDTIKKEKDGSLTLTLTYKNKMPRLLNLKLISKPGLRIYRGVDELEKKKSPSTYLISTPLGILSTREAVKQRVGGEVIVEIL